MGDPEQLMGFDDYLDDSETGLSTKDKMAFKGIDDKEDCMKPVLQEQSLMNLLATAESIQEFGAFNILRTIFIPYFKQAGIWGGKDADLLQWVNDIVPKGSLAHIERFSTGTFANVLVNLGTIAGKICGLMAIVAEKVHELSILIADLQNRIAVLSPTPTITLFMETAKGLFDTRRAVDMIEKYFAPCRAPTLPEPGVPSNTTTTTPPCGKQPEEPEPFEVPDIAKGTPEERGELKNPILEP